jgi:hypothetical protein
LLLLGLVLGGILLGGLLVSLLLALLLLHGLLLLLLHGLLLLLLRLSGLSGGLLTVVIVVATTDQGQSCSADASPRGRS